MLSPQLFTLCMFEPMQFIDSAAQFPLRAPVNLVLQQAVGVLLGTTLECILILGPCVWESLTSTPDEVRARFTLEKDVQRFRTQRSKRSLKAAEKVASENQKD